MHAACGEHLAWGYVDHPPLIAVVSRVTRILMVTPCSPALFPGSLVLLPKGVPGRLDCA
jgi:hypothetical protein